MESKKDIVSVDQAKLDNIKAVGLLPETFNSKEEKDEALKPLYSPDLGEFYVSSLIESPDGRKALANIVADQRDTLAELLENLDEDTAEKVVKISVFENNTKVFDNKYVKKSDLKESNKSIHDNIEDALLELEYLDPDLAQTILKSMGTSLVMKTLDEYELEFITSLEQNGYNVDDVYETEDEDENLEEDMNKFEKSFEEWPKKLSVIDEIDHEFYLELVAKAKEELKKTQDDNESQFENINLYKRLYSINEQGIKIKEENTNHRVRNFLLEGQAGFASDFEDEAGEYAQKIVPEGISSTGDIGTSQKLLKNVKMSPEEQEKWNKLLAHMDEETKKSEENQDEYSF